MDNMLAQHACSIVSGGRLAAECKQINAGNNSIVKRRADGEESTEAALWPLRPGKGLHGAEGPVWLYPPSFACLSGHRGDGKYGPICR